MKTKRSACLDAILCIAILASTGAFAETYLWTGGTGDWSNTTNWSPAGVPASGDTATIDGGTVTVSGTESIDVLNLNSGTLISNGTLTVLEAFNWTGAALLDGGGRIIIASAAVFTLSGPSDRTIKSTTLQIDGTFNHEGPGALVLDYAAILEIGEFGLVDLKNDLTWGHNWGNPATITNAGTIRKSAGTGESVITNIIPDNTSTGRFEVHSGTLSLAKGINGTGAFGALAGTELLIQSNSSLADITLTGAGLKRFTGGNLMLEGTCNGEMVELAGATLHGTHTLQGDWRWTSGQISGGTTTVDTGATFTLLGEGDHLIQSRTLLINGTFVHEGTGTLTLDYNPVIETGIGGLIDLLGDRTWTHVWGDTPIVNNAGIFRKTASATCLIKNMIFNNSGLLHLASGPPLAIGSLTMESVTFNNTGEARVETGTLTHNGGGTSTGQWATSNGTKVVFVGGLPILETGATFTGDGEWEIAGAAVNVAGLVTIPRLELSAGKITGVGTLTISETLDWTGASSMEGGGITEIASTAEFNLSGTGNHLLSNWTVQLKGLMNHYGPGELTFDYTSVLDISPSGVADFKEDLTWTHTWGNPAILTNNGIIRKSVGAGESIINNIVPTNSSTGRVEVLAGTLRLPNGINGSGVFDAAAGTELLVQASATLTDITLSGVGPKRFTGGILVLSGTCNGENVELAGATLNGDHTLHGNWKWISSQLTSGETTTVAGGATLTILGDGDHLVQSRTLHIDGSFIHEGNGSLTLDYAAVVETGSGGLIDLPGEKTWTHVWGNPPTINNAGTLQKTGTGTSLIKNIIFNNSGLLHLSEGFLTMESVTFNNTGEARVDSGILTHGGNGTSTGQWAVAEGTMVDFHTGIPTLESGATFTGPGQWAISGASVNVNGVVTIPRLELSSGKITGPGTVTVTHAFDWTNASTMDGGGTTKVSAGALSTISGEGDHLLSSRTLLIEGTLDHDGAGMLVLDYASTLDIAPSATVELNGDLTWTHVWGNPATINNAGIIRKTVGAGESVIQNIVPTNAPTGRIEVQQGTLRLPNGINGSGTLQVDESAILQVQTSSTLTDAQLPGLGLKQFTGGILVLAGTCNGENVELAGATLNGNHTLQGRWIWSSGTLSSAGTTTIDTGATLTLKGETNHLISARPLIIDGTFVHEGSGSLYLDYAASIETRAGGLIDIQGDWIWAHTWGNNPSLINAGTLRKSAGFGELVFTNPNPVNMPSGRIESMSGTIRFPNGITEGGTFHANEGAQILIQNTSSLTDVTFSGAGIQRLTNGNITLTGTCSSENTEFAGADIYGTHTLQGTWHWSTGSFNGPGTTTLAGSGILRIIGDNDHAIAQRTFINNGLIRHGGTGRLVLLDGSTLHNTSVGIVDLQTDSSWADIGSATQSTLINDGVIYKTGQGGGSFFEFAQFENNGFLVSWNGWFIVGGDWVYHFQQGWIYCIAINDSGIYYYDNNLACWAWTSPIHYSYLYWFNPYNTWVYYVQGTVPGDRWFYLYTPNEWMAEADMEP